MSTATPLSPVSPASPDSPVSPVIPPPTFQEKLATPFRQSLKDRQDLLDGGSQRLEENIELIRLWPDRKKKLQQLVLNPMQKWLTALKKMARPVKNYKRYRKEKKQLLRSKYPAIYSWSGFNLKASIGLLRVLNILRILIIISFVLGVIFLAGYFLMQLVGAV